MEIATPEFAPIRPDDKKSLFETALTTTPVLLTVLATFILGQSSGEMTRAQYQRATASQHQSKVTDQWAFFQAKRIRGATYEVTADLLLAQNADPFTRESLPEAAERLIQEIQSAETAVALSNGAGGKHSDLDVRLAERLQVLGKKALQAFGQITNALNPAPEGWKGAVTVLKPDNVAAALDALQTFPETKLEKNSAMEGIDADQRTKLEELLIEIRQFKYEKEISQRTLAISENTLDKVIENAKRNAAKVSERGKAVESVLDEFDVLVAGQTALAREFQRLLAGHLAVLKKSDADPRQQSDLRERMQTVSRLTSRLQGDFKAARHGFSARRYEDDARSNQDTAYLYEVLVLQSSARSDRHLNRSFGFLLAMLVAQVGVTIGTLSLALKRYISIWAVAVLSGIAAIAFGVYVFLGNW